MNLARFDPAGRVLGYILGEPLRRDDAATEWLHALVMALERAWANEELYAGAPPDVGVEERAETEGRAEAAVPAVCHELDALCGPGTAVIAAEALVEQARRVLDVARRVQAGEPWPGVYDPGDAWLPGDDRE